MYENVDSHDLTWTAGIVEADGSITIGRHGRGPANKSPSSRIWYSEQIAVSGKYFGIMERLHALYGGGLRERKFRSGSSGLHWHLSGARVSELLERILPYMATKKDQAECCIKLRTSIAEWKAKLGPGHTLPDEVWEYRRSLHDRCSNVKKGRRGRGQQRTV